MATRTWKVGATNASLAASYLEAAVPVDGDTNEFQAGAVNPTTPISGGGGGNAATFHFNLTTAPGESIYLDNFIDLTGGTPDAIGNVTVNNTGDYGLETTVAAIAGNADVTGTWLRVSGGNIAGNVAVNSGSYTAYSSHSIGGTLVVSSGAELIVDTGDTLTVADTSPTIDGTLTLTGTGIIDCAGPIDGTSPTIAMGDGAAIFGGVNVTDATWTVGTGCTLTCDQTGALNLGSTAAALQALAIDINGAGKTVTLAADVVGKSFDISAGTFRTGSNPYYDVTAYGDLILAGTPDASVANSTFTIKGDGTAENNVYTNQVGEIVQDAGVTTTVVASKDFWAAVHNWHGTVNAGDADAHLAINAGASGWWGTTDGTVAVDLDVFNTASPPGADIVLQDKSWLVQTTSSKTLTLGGSNCYLGTGTLDIYGTGAGDLMVLDIAGGRLTCGQIRLGTTAANTGSGVL